MAIKIKIPYFFTDENFKIGLKINLQSHIVNHANSYPIYQCIQNSELKQGILTKS